MLVPDKDDTAEPAPRAPDGPSDASDRADTAPRPRGWRPPRLDSLVPGNVADRGRAALAGVEAARTNIDAVGATLRDAGRRLRAPGALLGPPRPATGVPTAPAHPQHREQAEVAALLPRALELPVPQANGLVEPLGWTGEIYLVGEGAPSALIRRLPRKQASRGVRALTLAADLAVETIANSYSTDDQLRTVELLDLEGQVLLRSTPGTRRRDDGWTVRDVALTDGTPVAEITFSHRKARTREVVPAGDVRATRVSTDPLDLYPHERRAARVWREDVELASIRTQNGIASLTVGPLDDDQTALLVWAGILSWWGGAGS